jgi:hypothetical protein
VGINVQRFLGQPEANPFGDNAKPANREKKGKGFRQTSTLQMKLKTALKENCLLKKVIFVMKFFKTLFHIIYFQKVMSFKKKNFEMKKKLRNVQKRLMKTAATSDAPEETFTMSVKAIQDRLEELKKNQGGFYAPEVIPYTVQLMCNIHFTYNIHKLLILHILFFYGSFPIKESVKISVKEKCKKPEKGKLEFFKELYPDSNFFELHKKTHKESTIGNKLKIAMDPKELKEI